MQSHVKFVNFKGSQKAAVWHLSMFVRLLWCVLFGPGANAGPLLKALWGYDELGEPILEESLPISRIHAIIMKLGQKQALCVVKKRRPSVVVRVNV